MKFNANPPSGSVVVEWGRKNGRTDRHVEDDNRFPLFCEGT